MQQCCGRGEGECSSSEWFEVRVERPVWAAAEQLWYSVRMHRCIFGQPMLADPITVNIDWPRAFSKICQR
eukprot:2347035-Rhodomonas_salina.2